MRYDEDMCWQDDPPAICEDPDFDIDQVNTTMAAISNLYEPDLVSPPRHFQKPQPNPRTVSTAASAS
jgi:hypothetical protein